jgi:ATP-dependent helicase/nuclease subunit B
VPSRWLLRLDQVLAAAGAMIDEEQGANYRAWQATLDAAGPPRPTPPPAARPPVAARPRKLSVTRVETWLRDPYAIYARYILGLRALDPLAADAGAAERGTAVHEALDRFAAAFPDTLPGDAEARLLEIGQQAFAPWLDRPGVRAFWWPRFLRVAEWFIATERARRPHDIPLKTEVHGELLLKGPAGPFTLTAEADRIDRMADGRLAIIDYKTGQPPRKSELERGEAPQLPLEAAIAMNGGFAGIPAGDVGVLSFWRLSGGRVPGEIVDVPIEAAELANSARTQLMELIATFDKVETPYRSRPRPAAAPRFSDYDHLARVKEWTAGGPGDV